MTGPRTFTPAEANRMLPLVRRIVADILAAGRELRRLAPDGLAPESRVPEVDRQMQRLKDLVNELEQLGCQYKDWNFDVGLVDFPARIEGRDVLLCWRSDEPEIRFYHGLEDGYTGRRPIPEPLARGS